MLETFRDMLQIKEEAWESYAGFFNCMKIPAKTRLLEEGAVSRKLFLVETGCLRAWFNNDGKEVTIQFFLENSMVASIESYRKEQPSLVNIESIESSTVWWIAKEEMDKLLDKVLEEPKTRKLYLDAVFERTFVYMKQFISSIRDTPQERYLQLLEEHPEIVRRVPQHYIASYLGITRVHLSRIKKRLATEK